MDIQAGYYVNLRLQAEQKALALFYRFRQILLRSAGFEPREDIGQPLELLVTKFRSQNFAVAVVHVRAQSVASGQVILGYRASGLRSLVDQWMQRRSHFHVVRPVQKQPDRLSAFRLVLVDQQRVEAAGVTGAGLPVDGSHRVPWVVRTEFHEVRGGYSGDGHVFAGTAAVSPAADLVDPSDGLVARYHRNFQRRPDGPLFSPIETQRSFRFPLSLAQHEHAALGTLDPVR